MSKSTFGVNSNLQSDVDTGSTLQPDVSTLKSPETARPELGAIWEHLDRNQNKYMKIKFKISKDKLQELMSSVDDSGNVSANFVAFHNDTKGDDRRPAFRIFEPITPNKG